MQSKTRDAWRLSVAACTMASAFLLSPSGSGDLVASASAQTEDDVERAKAVFKEAQAASKNGDHAGAAKLFEESYELSQRAAIMYFVADAYERAGDLYVAQQYYQKYLDAQPDADNADQVLDTIIALQKRINDEMGRVMVTSAVEGREVFVEGEDEPRCVTPCELVLKPGSYALSVRADGMPTYEERVKLVAGARSEVAAELRKERVGYLFVDAGEGADGMVRVGSVEERLPLSGPIKVPAGSQRVEVTGGGNSWAGDVVVEDGERLRMFVPVADIGGVGGMSPLRVASLASLGAGLGFLVGGLAMGQQTAATYTLVEERSAQGAVDDALIDLGSGQQLTANVLIGVGVAGLVAGGGLFAWDLVGGSGEVASPSEDAPAEESDVEAPALEDPADIDLL